MQRTKVFSRSLASFLLIILAACSPASSDKSASNESPRTKAEPISAPEKFRVRLTTTKGPFDVEVYRAWAPRGADRFYELVQKKYYDDASFFRVIKGFAAQFGINRDPATTQLWNDLKIIDDPAKQKNTRGTMTFASRGPNSRSTQVFINLADNKSLDSSGFAPFGKISDEGMEVVDKLYSGYGEAPDPDRRVALTPAPRDAASRSRSLTLGSISSTP